MTRTNKKKNKGAPCIQYELKTMCDYNAYIIIKKTLILANFYLLVFYCTHVIFLPGFHGSLRPPFHLWGVGILAIDPSEQRYTIHPFFIFTPIETPKKKKNKNKPLKKIKGEQWKNVS